MWNRGRCGIEYPEYPFVLLIPVTAGFLGARVAYPKTVQFEESLYIKDIKRSLAKGKSLGEIKDTHPLVRRAFLIEMSGLIWYLGYLVSKAALPFIRSGFAGAFYKMRRQKAMRVSRFLNDPNFAHLRGRLFTFQEM